MHTHTLIPPGFAQVNFNPAIPLPLNAQGRILNISHSFNMNMREKCESLAVRRYILLKKFNLKGYWTVTQILK